jgi:predicted DNA-binding transcriptional regulator YafY
VKRQIINPYQMVAAEGRYYLICNNDKYNNAANYRIDRIQNIKLLDSDVKPKKQVEGLEKGLNLQEYMYQNLNMFTSSPIRVEFLVPENYISLVIDFFGEHVKFYNSKQKGIVSCRLKVSEEAMKHWAVQHANIAKVISPEHLVDAIRDEIRKANELYEIGDYIECALDEADYLAEPTSDRMTHDEVFSDVRKRVNA